MTTTGSPVKTISALVSKIPSYLILESGKKGGRLMRKVRFAVISVSFICCFLNAFGQSGLPTGGWPTPEIEREVRSHADHLWKTILTHCGDSSQGDFYYYSGSGLDNLSAASQPIPFNNGEADGFTEYAGVRFGIAPGSSGPAARSNAQETGDVDGGIAIMVAQQFRTGSIPNARSTAGGWRDGPLVRINATDVLDPQTTTTLIRNSLGGKFGIAGEGGLIAVRMRRRQGVWYYSLVGSFGSLERSEESLMDSDENSHGPDVVVKRDRYGSQFGSHGAPIQPIFCNNMPDPAIKIAAPEAGAAMTADDFAATVPALLRQAATDRGLPPDTYDKEAKYLGSVAHLCAGITPKMAANAVVGHTDIEDVNYLGERYRPCGVRNWNASEVSGNEHGYENDVVMEVHSNSWRAGQGFTLRAGIPSHVSRWSDVLIIKDVRIQQIAAGEAGSGNSGDPNGLSSPAISNFRVYPLTVRVRQDVIVEFSARTAVGLGEIVGDMMRAPDVDGKPGTWSAIVRKQGGSVNSFTNFSFRDQPRAPGKYWYGARVLDRGGHVTRESEPVLVTVQ